MKFTRMLIFFALTLSLLFSDLPAADMRDFEQELIKISEKAKKSVASIKTERASKNNFADPFYDFLRQFGFGGTPPRQPYNPKSQAMGSGFVIDESEGYVVTNNHVIEKADSIEITINGKKYNGKVVGTDPQTDIGLVKIKNFAKGEIQELKLADSNKIKAGSIAIAIGNPFGLSHTVTMGIVSAKGRAGMNVTEYEDFIQTDAAINPGNSGGPLLNIEGEVIGMNTAIYSQSGGYMGIGFAVPSNMIKNIASQLRAGKKIQRAMLGISIQELSEDLRNYLKIDKSINGITVISVAKGSPAEKAGIEPYDIITKFNDKEVTNTSMFKNSVAFSPYGKRLPIELIREGKTKKIEVILDKNFKYETSSDVSDEIGISLTDEKGKVVVSQVSPNSLAFSAGIMRGDIILAINKRQIKNSSEALKIIDKYSQLLFLIRRQNDEFFVVLNK